jgi:tol-pal system protein YbgF
MSPRSHQLTGIAALAAGLALWLALPSQALAQSDDMDPEMHIQRLENQLRQLTGQNEDLQYRNRQLEERLRQLQGGAQTAPSSPPASQPSVAAMPPAQTAPYGQPQAQGGYQGGNQGGNQGGYGGGYNSQSQPGYGQPQPGYGQPQGGQGGYEQRQSAASAPIVQEAPQAGQRRGDAFDPTQNPNAPGAPRALGGGQLPIQQGAAGGRVPGDPMTLSGARYQQGGLQQGGVSSSPPASDPGGNTVVATAPPSNSPRDEYDLGIGYMQRKDYALAEQTMRNFAQKYPSDPLLGDSQYWLGESLYQRQQYRDAAEIFLTVTSKYNTSAKAPDALLRLGQSLAALKEKEAACAALGEVTRKYPRASTGVKTAVDREQKRVKC